MPATLTRCRRRTKRRATTRGLDPGQGERVTRTCRAPLAAPRGGRRSLPGAERLGTAAAPREIRVALLFVRHGNGDLERAGALTRAAESVAVVSTNRQNVTLRRWACEPLVLQRSVT